MSFKQKIYHLVEKGSHGTRLNLIFDYSIMILIILNTVAIVLTSIEEVKAEFGTALYSFEIFSVIIFSIEYLLRIYVSDMTHPSTSRTKSVFKFIFSPFGLIDLLAIIPFYLPFLIKIDLRFLRLLRLMRFFRLLKINRYNDSLNIIWEVIKDKRTELAITGFVTLLILLVASFLMYDVERHVQPDKFPNILASFWWATSTLTTVGYGDVYPVTTLGKIISGVIAATGVGIVALPTGIISAGFMSRIDRRNETSRKCPHCGKDIHS